LRRTHPVDIKVLFACTKITFMRNVVIEVIGLKLGKYLLFTTRMKTNPNSTKIKLPTYVGNRFFHKYHKCHNDMHLVYKCTLCWKRKFLEFAFLKCK
jgi:hypothetical protein